MRTLSVKLLLLFLPILVAGQTHFEEVSKPNLQNNELKGNSILHNSSKINAAKNSGMAFLGFEVKNIALDYTEEMIPTSIEKIVLEENHCLITFSAPSNCGYSFLGEIEIVDDTLNLIYHGYGTTCFGNCLFSFQYEIQKDIMNENILNLRYFMINGDLSTKTELSKKLVD
ncbi:hypothetical protein EQG68_14470 [Flavobacterium piscinae]|uniref:DUF4468 domain-containing protein n=1 Tax=Flavobacterium piscinae TaxID=2506424 RepID=A0A4Q1KF68_9FLAO|nr:hypothetical protein [Flavobacterium piscinae]RXR28323.1 hypothetical protein EQG68_14470 [Flavobacterium piscinae]